MPFFLQIAASSSSIERDASETSVSPAQNFSKPPPVPDVPTVTFTFGFWPWNSSAAAWANGPTVLEPSILMLPDRSPPPLLPPLSSSSSPQAATLGKGGQQLELADGEMQGPARRQHHELGGPDLQISGADGPVVQRGLHGGRPSHSRAECPLLASFLPV